MKISKDLKKLTTTQTEMAKALGVTQPRVNQLIQDDIVVKGKNGAVLVVESLKNFYKSREDSDETDNDGSDLNFATEKAKHEKTKRKIAELKLAKMLNNVYDARTVELVMTEMLSNLRTQLLGLPSKLAPIIEHKKKEEIYDIMTQEITEKLSELSEYSPDLFTAEDITEADDEDSE